MAITTHDELKAATKDFMLDDSAVETAFESLLTLAEQAIYYGLVPDGNASMDPLRVREMETVSSPSITMTSGVGTLPTAFLHQIRAVEVVTPRRPLEWITPMGADELYDSSGGLANHYTIVGNSLLAYPRTSNSIELTYYALPTTLVGTTNTVSAMLTKYPGIYLAACCAMACYWQKDMEEMQAQMSMLKSFVMGANRLHMASKLVGQTIINTKRRLP